ncbi:hypothetical protein ACLB2K_057142 [Fragaria x ananassa]
MVDEVSRLTAALAISEKGKVSFGAAGAAAYSGHAYAVGRLLSSKKKVVPKSFMATMAAMWGKKNRLQIGQEGDRQLQWEDIGGCSADQHHACLGGNIWSPSGSADQGGTLHGNDLTSAWLTFKYERMCGFCWICGLLEHPVSGCCGPPDMSAAVRIGAPTGNPNLNSSASPSGPPLNPFQNIGSRPVQPRLASVQPLVFRQVVESPSVPVSREIVLSTKMISGTKRNASSLMEVDLGKRPRGPPTVLEAANDDLGPVLELSLPNFAGTLIVSPPKKQKVGRPEGSKNRSKEEDIPLWKLKINANAKKLKTKKRIQEVKRMLELERTPVMQTDQEKVVLEESGETSSV